MSLEKEPATVGSQLELGEGEPDFTCPEVPDGAFESSGVLASSLAQPVSDSCAAAAERAAALTTARAEALPDFLQTGAEKWRLPSAALKAVQAMKAREVEHVRYRSTAAHDIDAELESVKQCMRSQLRHAGKGHDLMALVDVPGSASTSPRDWASQR